MIIQQSARGCHSTAIRVVQARVARVKPARRFSAESDNDNDDDYDPGKVARLVLVLGVTRIHAT